MDDVEFYLFDLASRFKGIDGQKYYLSYSGGKDSHFLYWFIKEYLHDNSIEIVGFNTYMEHPEIRERIYKNADEVILPKMKPFEIKEKYGSPCFSKEQDQVIYYYQKGNRAQWMIDKVTGKAGRFGLSKKASELLLSGKLHPISHLCCKCLKKDTAHRFERERERKAILGVRGSESLLRKTQYKTCFTKDRKFTPIHDLSTEMLEKIYKECNIEIPQVYQYINRTGCMGCPYGSWKGDTELELNLLNDNQRKFVIEYFKESYDVLGIDYKNKQTTLL